MSSHKPTHPLQFVLYQTPRRDYQLSLEKGGSGYRLFGPDFIGDSSPIRASNVTEAQAKEIRSALDHEFPPKHKLWFSGRGMPLVYTGPTPKVAIITCENYLKWYGLDVVCPDGIVRKLDAAHPDFDRIDREVERAARNACWCDHTFHPGYVREIAEKLGFAVDEQALEMIAGRWAIETLNLPQMEYVKR